jgi:hypothetical protein
LLLEYKRLKKQRFKNGSENVVMPWHKEEIDDDHEIIKSLQLQDKWQLESMYPSLSYSRAAGKPPDRLHIFFFLKLVNWHFWSPKWSK